MMIFIRHQWLFGLILLPRFAAAQPVLPEAGRLTKALDTMEVEKHWLPGVIVDWKRGEPTGQAITDSPKNHTHCSQFAAAACDRLGVYLLHPPEHSSKLLANAQFDWLSTDKARRLGWSPVPDGITAQKFANKGRIVIAIYKNPDPAKHGHVAIVRPFEKPESLIRLEGPQIIQAGASNYISTSLKEGFRHHPGAFEKNEIRFFTHAVKAQLSD